MSKKSQSHSKVVSLGLSNESEFELYRWEKESTEELEESIFGPKPLKGGPRPDYYRPPNRPDLTYREVREIEEEHRKRWSDIWKQAKKPKSRLTVPTLVWAWQLRKLSPKLDDLTKALLATAELYLCRFVFQAVEAEGEQIEWLSLKLELEQADHAIYSLWPVETYKPKSVLKAEAKVSTSIGLTRTLEVIELPVGANVGVDVVWQKKWEWATASIEAAGKARTAAEWKIRRDSSAPFAGDREFYLIAQFPRNHKPKEILATFEAKINPRGVYRSFIYDNKKDGPDRIKYHLA